MCQMMPLPCQMAPTPPPPSDSCHRDPSLSQHAPSSAQMTEIPFSGPGWAGEEVQRQTAGEGARGSVSGQAGGAERRERAAAANQRGEYGSWSGVGWGWRWDPAANEALMSAGDPEVTAALICGGVKTPSKTMRSLEATRTTGGTLRVSHRPVATTTTPASHPINSHSLFCSPSCPGGPGVGTGCCWTGG